MHKRKSVVLVLANTELSKMATSTATSPYDTENSYCGYCCKLIEIKSQSSEECVGNVEIPDDYEYIIICASCKGVFHVCCTALSSSPIYKIREQCLNWKCNTCVKKEAPNVSSETSSPDETNPKIISYSDKHRDDVIDKRLTAMLCAFGKDLQNVCGRVIETHDLAKELESSKQDEYLVIEEIPINIKYQFMEEISGIAAAKGIKLITQEEQSVPTYTISDKTYNNVSFVIRLDAHMTRQLLLNSYLNSIMHPITMQQQQQQQLSTKPTSFYLANDRDIEVSSTTCLLPHNSVGNNQMTTSGLSSSSNNRHRSIYMYEYLAANASSSNNDNNPTMLVKAISGRSGGVTGDSDNDSVFHDEMSSVIVPIIKISGVPKRVRLASKENFDDIEGKFIDNFFLLVCFIFLCCID